MAPEPLHLAGIVKYCRRCGSNDVKYMYDNNGKSDQPRYKCLNNECRAFFTYGGKCRGPYGGKRPRVPVEPRLSNRNGLVADSRIAKPEVRGNCSARNFAKPNPGALLPEVRRSLQVVPQSEPLEVGNICDDDHVGVVLSTGIGALRSCSLSSASNVKSNCISSASKAKSKLFQELPKNYKGSVFGGVFGEAGSSAGAGIVDQRKASKAVHEGEESKVELVKAILGIAPYGLVPVSERRQLKRIRMKHQEREFVIEYFT